MIKQGKGCKVYIPNDEEEDDLALIKKDANSRD